MSITIQVNKKFTQIKFNVAKLQKLIKKVCRQFRVCRAVIEIEIVGDLQIRKLNKKILSKNRITDCISFDLTGNNGRADSPRDSAIKSYQIIVNVQKAGREAKKRQHSQDAELALYIVHGLLHNLGFDDRTRTQAEQMHKTEDEFLQKSGYGMVYNNGRK
jgi:probable rRNA maturation factor